ncbi:MAG: hypothetical protein ACE5GS_10970 [Kiloniellaceae bacterium]
MLAATRFLRRPRSLWPAAVLLALLAGCTYRGAIDQPVTLKATWFSYLNGDDIRAACVAGAPSWYRLVYNADYDQQLRSYEVVADGAGGAYYAARVQMGGGIDLTRLSLRDPQSPARWTTARVRLSGADLAELEAALARSGAFAAAPQGLRLASEEFYWIFSGCREGRFYFNAWRYPSQRFAGLLFPDVLLRHDRTGIAVNPPRRVAPIDRTRSRGAGPEEDATPRFDLEIGEAGLKGVHPLF